ncbi:MAG: tRNA (adenosine(37)-N6)-threonylcarbamoyltransferase complex dimerization subunit type 1 TsaB [Patescibacteria group bacterium]
MVKGKTLKMILVIDTSDKKCLVGLYHDQKLDRISWQWQKDTGSETLQNIQKILSKHRIKITDLKAIAVNQGPGSYTGTRVGITLANALGWSLRIPVIGYGQQKLETVLGRITQKLKGSGFSPDHFPTPRYK